MNLLVNFYDRIFLYYYNLKKKNDSDPQYFPIIIISIEQAFNLITILIPLFYLTRNENFIKKIPLIFIICYFIILALNFYKYQVKSRKEIIIQKNIKLSFKFKLFTYFYFIISILFPLFLIFILNDFFGRG